MGRNPEFESRRGEHHAILYDKFLKRILGQNYQDELTHQAETRGQYALTLIVMKNAKLVPPDQQHIHV